MTTSAPSDLSLPEPRNAQGVDGLQRAATGLALLLALLLASAPAAARDSGAYLGGSLGAPDWNGTVDGVHGSSRGTATNVYGGYDFSPDVAIEGGAMDLGRMDGGAAGTVSAAGVFADVVGRYELAPRWWLLGRVGVARARFSTDRGGAWSNGLGLGTGIEYELTPDVALRAEYQVHHYADVFGSKPDIGQVTAGVKLAF